MVQCVDIDSVVLKPVNLGNVFVLYSCYFKKSCLRRHKILRCTGMTVVLMAYYRRAFLNLGQ